MFPYDILFGINLYVVLLGVAAFVAIYSFGKLADVAEINGRVQNLSIFTTILAVVLGYGSAVIFQALYNIAREGKFVINSNTGATFYGGLIGGTACFILIYFVWGYFKFDDKLHVKQFYLVSEVAPASIVIGHSIGRIGCLMAGCCHGRATDAWYGIVMHTAQGSQKYVPTQLFEAIFLALLFVLFAYRIYHKKGYNFPIYMIGYGTWRFVIEYFRDDYRGTTFISFLTPSQLTAVGMIVAGIILIFVLKKVYARKSFEITESSYEVQNVSDSMTDEKTEEEDNG